jgi:hypothetical protein
MKDALGHGSGPHGEFLEPGAHSIMPSRLERTMRVAELRTRLSDPKPGLGHSFMQGVKDALAAGKKLHDNSFAPTSRN